MAKKDSYYRVVFVRTEDWKPNENYEYWDMFTAYEHFSLFKNDDTGYYKRIELLKVTGDEEHILDTINFE